MNPEKLTLIACMVMVLCTLFLYILLRSALKQLKVNTMLMKYIAIHNGVASDFIDQIFDECGVSRTLKYKNADEKNGHNRDKTGTKTVHFNQY